MQERRQRLLFRGSEWRQKRPDGGQATLQQLLAEETSPLGEMKRDGTFVARLATFNEAVCD